MRAYRVMDDASSRKKNSEIMPRNDNVVTGLRPFLLSPLPGCGVPLAQGGEGAAVHQGANAAFKQNNGALTPLRPRLPEDFFSSPSRPPSAHVSSLLSRSVDSNSTADQTSASKPKSEPPPARTTPSAVRRNEGLARLPQEQQARATRSRTGLRSESKLADEDEQSRVIVSASHHSGPPGQKSDTRIKTKQTVQDHLSSHVRLLQIVLLFPCIPVVKYKVHTYAFWRADFVRFTLISGGRRVCRLFLYISASLFCCLEKYLTKGFLPGVLHDE